ncbi:hypothetical protein JMA_24510 [Jeotgalibacillus malaysiensis]|uniref:DUF2953 domain-containing protein n=1 Tax=Jeotgalibacillus malaysiensis TaxID=1508404 RepID=A0A0B5AT69_9BACL|nr:DUF2953 domain-containing protein [Jeotgalibacillus malaysiensis]AJD91768.1 hypothetical protein JMA_24510 [Jeotgalibacillus malaysiensis]
MIKLLFLLCLPLLLFLKCKCMIDIEWKGKNIQFTIVVKIAGVHVKRYMIPVELAPEPEYKINRKPKKLTKSDLQKLKLQLNKIKEKVVRLNSWLKKTLQGFSIESLYLTAGVGTNSPDLSALLNGGIGLIQALIVQQLSRYIRLTSPPKLMIKPVFSRSQLTVVCHCIISVSIAHLIKAGVMLLIRRMANYKRTGSDLLGASN